MRSDLLRELRAHGLGVGTAALLCLGGCGADASSSGDPTPQAVEQADPTVDGGPAVQTRLNRLRKIRLDDRFMHHLTVRPGPNGKLESSCESHGQATPERQAP